MGSLPLSELIQPSIELAENGFLVTEKQATSLNSKRDEFIKVNGRETFYGKTFNKGDTIKNLTLQKLTEISKYGNKGFYEGGLQSLWFKK